MKARTMVLLAAAMIGTTGPAMAQRRWDATVSGGVAFPTMDLGNVVLMTGGGFDLSVSYRFLEHLAVYGGWGWHQFPTDDATVSFAGAGIDVTETGYNFGLHFEHPFAGSGSPAIVVRGGGTLSHIEIEDSTGSLVSDSGHGLGWEAGVGVAFSLGARWQLTPLVQYSSLKQDQPVGSTTTPVTLAYVGLDIGLVWSF